MARNGLFRSDPRSANIHFLLQRTCNQGAIPYAKMRLYTPINIVQRKNDNVNIALVSGNETKDRHMGERDDLEVE